MPSMLRSPRFWLWLVLLFGLSCRFHGLKWDEGAGLHPDERFCSGIVPRLEWPSSFGNWFDSSKSPLNPSNLVNAKGERDTHYVYGQMPLIIAKVAIGTHDGAAQFLIDRAVAIPGLDSPFGDDIPKSLPFLRALSGIFDCLLVLFALLIGRRLLGKTWGLAAGVLVSMAALNIQQSHFFTTDTFAATFLTMAFWNGVRWMDTRKWFDALGLGLWFGCSLACKISGLFFAVAWLGFVILAWRRHGTRHALPLAIGSFLVAFWTFRTFHPMMFLGESGPFDLRLDERFLNIKFNPNPNSDQRRVEFVGDFGQQLGITNGSVDVPFNVQWIGRAKWGFSLLNLGWWGFGWPLLIAGFAGGAWATRRLKSAPVLFIAALFVLVSIGVQGAQFSKFTRYFLPLSPMFALLATYFWRELLAWKPKIRPIAATAFAYSFAWCVAVASVYGRPHPRMEASRWIVDNVPKGTPVAIETGWDEGLPISWVPPGDGGLKSQKLESYDLDTPEKRAHLEQVLSQSEWIFISSGRSWQNVPRWPQKWPMTTQFYRALFAGELGFDKVKEFTNYPGVGSLRFPDDGLEEALSVYEHPRVLLFHKRADFSPELVARALGNVALPTTDQFQPRAAPAKWDFLPQPF